MSLLGVVTQLKTLAATATFTVATTGTVYTPSFPLHGGDAFGIQVIATSGGAVDVLVSLEESNVALTNAQEEASNANYVEPDGFADILNVVDTATHIKQMTPVPARFGRLKLQGQGSNAADTALTIYLFRQEHS